MAGKLRPRSRRPPGLVVGKLNAHYIKHHMDRYLDCYKETVGAEFTGKRGIATSSASWEAGTQDGPTP
jgi:hypothetical protein